MKRKKTYNLRELRLAAGLTMQQLAEQTGINIASVQAIETGRGKNYSVIAKHTLADFFHVPARRLFPEIQTEIDLLMGKSRQVQMFIPREDVRKG